MAINRTTTLTNGNDSWDAINSPPLNANDKVYGLAGDDTVWGWDGADNLLGGDGNDTLYGESSNDKLYGGKHNDKIWGGEGNDVLTGNLGADELTGEAGNDTFRFEKLADWGTHFGFDSIEDFGPGQDKVDVKAIDANAGVTGNQTFTSVLEGTSPTQAGQIYYWNSGDSTLVFFNTDSSLDAKGVDRPEMMIHMASEVDLTKADFVL